jgi:hypothetical protein
MKAQEATHDQRIPELNPAGLKLSLARLRASGHLRRTRP